MGDLDLLKSVVGQSTELWTKGKHDEALHLIDECVAKAELENKTVWVKVLSMHASLIADSKGDLAKARRYCERVLSLEPENALALHALADVMFRQGKTDLARHHAARAYALVVHSSAKEDRGLLEVLMKKWPDIGNWS
jgi:tetratricopeptide (TPR) repeat protein